MIDFEVNRGKGRGIPFLGSNVFWGTHLRNYSYFV